MDFVQSELVKTSVDAFSVKDTKEFSEEKKGDEEEEMVM